MQHVAVELGGDPGGVVVGGDQPSGVFDQVSAEQQAVAGDQALREGAQEPGGCAGSRLPMVPPRNATSRRPPAGSSGR
jgi:hypothetical protein